MSFQGTIHGSVQTGYFDHPLPGYPGQLASVAEPFVVNGYPVEEANGIPAGLGVVKGTALAIASNQYGEITAPWHVKLPETSSVAADFVGVAIREHSMGNDANGNPVYYDDTMASVVREGKVFVTANVTVAAGDNVFLIVNDTQAHGFAIGSFSNANPGASDAVQLSNASFIYPAAAGGLTVIEFRQRQ